MDKWAELRTKLNKSLLFAVNRSKVGGATITAIGPRHRGDRWPVTITQPPSSRPGPLPLSIWTVSCHPIRTSCHHCDRCDRDPWTLTRSWHAWSDSVFWHLVCTWRRYCASRIKCEVLKEGTPSGISRDVNKEYQNWLRMHYENQKIQDFCVFY